MEKLISVAVMRTSDAAEIAGGTDSKTLMYRAGLGLFQSWDWHGKIDIVTGSGNNAGDGYVLALLLHQHGIPCRIVRTSEKVSPDGGYFFAKCEEPGHSRHGQRGLFPHGHPCRLPAGDRISWRTAPFYAAYRGADQPVRCGCPQRGYQQRHERRFRRRVLRPVRPHRLHRLSEIRTSAGNGTGKDWQPVQLRHRHPLQGSYLPCSPETTGLRNRGTSFRQSPFHKFWTISTFLPVNRHNAYKCWRMRSGRRCSFSL